VAITVIDELHAKPGRRDELRGVLESLIATQGPGQDGFLRSTARADEQLDPAQAMRVRSSSTTSLTATAMAPVS
jgi:hypothetical protein